ncbi:MAG: hypothetical protein KAI79_12260 [Bacteroidales bacterium]|nr:hypothetical protein [Bacteroidales bacterium]
MQITIELPKTLQVQLITIAKQQNMSLQEYIVQYLFQNTAITEIPDQDTQKVIEDARQGKNMQKISLNKLKDLSNA